MPRGAEYPGLLLNRPWEKALKLVFQPSQQVHEKMFNVANHQGNANQNHNEVSPHTGQKAIIKKNTTNAGERVEKREPSYTVGGNVSWCSHYGEQYGGSLKN